jgi:tRNA nucleotidyltransferase (CCA-adding enzyme)
VPNRFRDLARLVARYHGTVHQALSLKPQTVLRLIADADGLRQPQRFEEMLLACEADARGRQGLEDRDYPQAERLRTALRAAKGVEAAQIKAERGLEGEALGKALHDERLRAVKRALGSSTAVEEKQ